MGFHAYIMEMAKVSNDSSSRPSLAFILGTIVVTLLFLGATIVFLCCYHWAKILKEAAEYNVQVIPTPRDEGEKGAVVVTIEQLPSEVPVVFMPGNQFPTFIAVPSVYVPLQAPLESTTTGNEGERSTADMPAHASL